MDKTVTKLTEVLGIKFTLFSHPADPDLNQDLTPQLFLQVVPALEFIQFYYACIIVLEM